MALIFYQTLTQIISSIQTNFGFQKSYIGEMEVLRDNIDFYRVTFVKE